MYSATNNVHKEYTWSGVCVPPSIHSVTDKQILFNQAHSTTFQQLGLGFVNRYAVSCGFKKSRVNEASRFSLSSWTSKCTSIHVKYLWSWETVSCNLSSYMICDAINSIGGGALYCDYTCSWWAWTLLNTNGPRRGAQPTGSVFDILILFLLYNIQNHKYNTYSVVSHFSRQTMSITGNVILDNMP